MSGRRNRVVYRFDLAFQPRTDRLLALNNLGLGDPILVVPIGGQLRTVVDWWTARSNSTNAVEDWEPVVDPDTPDVPLFIDFSVPSGRSEERALIPWLYMGATSCSDRRVNTQFMWVRSLPPPAFATSVPIVCALLPPLVAEEMLYFDLATFRRTYGWSDAVRDVAEDIIQRLNTGTSPATLQSVCPPAGDRFKEWGYGHTLRCDDSPVPEAPADVSQRPTNLLWSEPAGPGALLEPRSSAAPLPSPKVGGSRGQATRSKASKRRRVSVVEPRVGSSSDPAPQPLWTDAFNISDLSIHPVYEACDTYEDPADRRFSAEKQAWWEDYLYKRTARHLPWTDSMLARLQRYRRAPSTARDFKTVVGPGVPITAVPILVMNRPRV